ncbi:helix-turn-helix domain-containing protein [Paracoccus sp. (in: a-proteobacteria)]|uniref:helix-turn-helix domain-containing protein n=1 Tax=Paracoccus sp. TaxID=267 RepID=UPI0026DFF86B|nr:helix-turn-helix domain-containing protein [Paracoccus sp. (in: a-proteobacteria)]MDO5648376.1 helix-turn-helix domain-containing protein [Paracoccus sp. (in: a-proteobacteria)]
MTDIPSSLEDVAEACGTRAALALLAHFEGIDLYFPHNPRPDHPILQALGPEDGPAVCHYMAGETVTIPNRSPAKRRARILALHEQGLSTAAIARKMHQTQRWVREVIRRAGEDDQGDLFG